MRDQFHSANGQLSRPTLRLSGANELPFGAPTCWQRVRTTSSACNVSGAPHHYCNRAANFHCALLAEQSTEQQPDWPRAWTARISRIALNFAAPNWRANNCKFSLPQSAKCEPIMILGREWFARAAHYKLAHSRARVCLPIWRRAVGALARGGLHAELHSTWPMTRARSRQACAMFASQSDWLRE